MDAPAKVIEFLPSTPAKWALWLSLILSGSLYTLLDFLQVDTLLPLAQAQKLSILLPSAALLLIGAIFILYFVIRSYNKQNEELAQVKATLKSKSFYGKVPTNQRQDVVPPEPESFND